MAELTNLAVRTLHVLGMAVLLGGAGALWYASRFGDGAVIAFATRYEWAFWGLLGVMVVTGVGNLGALGAPGPETRWGTILILKLAVVLAFVVGSLLRTLAVLQMACDDSHVVRRLCRRAYGATTGVLLVLVVLAEVLAHG